MEILREECFFEPIWDGEDDDEDVEEFFEPELYAYKFNLIADNETLASLYLDVEMRETSWRIMQVYTEPKHRKKGYAEQLVREAVKFGCDNAPSWIKGFSLDASCDEAKRVYMRCGFVITSGNEMYLIR